MSATDTASRYTKACIKKYVQLGKTRGASRGGQTQWSRGSLTRARAGLYDPIFPEPRKRAVADEPPAAAPRQADNGDAKKHRKSKPKE